MSLALREAPGAGAPVLWIHGYTLDSSIWRRLWDLLPGWRHLGVDLPGHGASPPLAPGETLATLAERIAVLALARGVRHVVGLSFGGMVALQVVAQRPAAFASLALGAPALGGGAQDRHAQARNLELMRLYRERGAGPWLGELWMRWPPDIFKGAARHPELWRELAGAVGRHAWAELADSAMQGLTNHPQPQRALRAIRAATLVLIGDEDMDAFKRSAELIRRAVPGCRRLYLPGAGHLCLLEAPDAAAKLLEEHFRGSDAA